jgi:non-ribosomal peptide synthetase component F
MIFLLPHAVINSAERCPDKEAVRYRSQSLTYEQLIGRSNSLARVLIEQGVVRGDRVGIYCKAWRPLSLCTAASAGAAYVPLDPLAICAPWLRLEDCGIRHLVVSQAG